MITTQGKLVTCKLNELDHHPLNVRSVHEYNQVNGQGQTVAELGASLHSDGVLSMQPLRAIEAFRTGERHLVFDGNRRLEGCLHLAPAIRDNLSVQVILLPANTRPQDVIRLSCAANENLKPSWWSKLHAMEALIRLGTTKSAEIAPILKVSDTEVSLLHKLLRLSPSIREAGEKGLIAATEALAILKREGDEIKGEASILKNLTEHPNQELTKAKFELTKAADSARETALKASKDYDAACSIRKVQQDNLSKTETSLKTATGKEAEQLKRELETHKDAISRAQAEMDRLAKVSKEAKEAAEKADAEAKKARQGGKGSKRKGKGKGNDSASGKGQGGSESAKFVTATEILTGKLESLLTANFAGSQLQQQQTAVINGCVKLLSELRGKFLKT